MRINQAEVKHSNCGFVVQEKLFNIDNRNADDNHVNR